MKLINPNYAYREPVYQNEFIMEFIIPSAVSSVTDAKALSIPCYKATTPTISTIGSTELHYINYKVNFATSEYTLGDLVTGFYNFNMGEKSVRSILYDWSMYIINIQTGTKGYAGDPTTMGGYKTRLTLYELNPDGVSVMAAYLIIGAWPLGVPAAQKDWSTKNEIDKVDITWKYDTFYRVNVGNVGQTNNYSWGDYSTAE